MAFAAGGFAQVKAWPAGRVMQWLPTVWLSKRAITKASPRLPALTSPPAVTAAASSLLVRNTARAVTSRSVPSA